MTKLFEKVNGSWVEQTNWKSIWDRPAGVWNIKYESKQTRLYGVHKNNSLAYELDLVTFASLGSSTLGVNPTGIGGFLQRLYACTNSNSPTTDYRYELDPDTRAIINSVGIGFASYQGMGGNNDDPWCTNENQDKMTKVNPDTLATTATFNSPENKPSGQGGIDDSRIWNNDYNSHKLREINPTTGATLAIYQPVSQIYGAGGIAGRLLVGSSIWGVTEINPDTGAAIGTQLGVIGLHGIGGLK